MEKTKVWFVRGRGLSFYTVLFGLSFLLEQFLRSMVLLTIGSLLKRMWKS